MVYILENSKPAPDGIFAYQYDAALMITNVVLETGTNIVYSYDDLDRLTGETRSGEPGTFYGYDLAGNRTWSAHDGATNTYTLGLGNRLASWTGGTYGHDTAGCVTNIVRSGRPELDLAWNGLYQVESVATNGATAESYGYDALGRRLYTVQNGVTNWHIYDGLHVVAEVNGAGAVLRSYVWGAGIDNLLAFTDHTGGVTNTYYALTDHLGTVHAFADENGTVIESYKYDAWGNVLGVFDGNGSPLSESALGNHYLHQGRWYSWATGLYCHRARWRDPETGRWLSNDPIGISGGLNQFVAFGNNPVMFRDPSGLCPNDDIRHTGTMTHMNLVPSDSWRGINVVQRVHGSIPYTPPRPSPLPPRHAFVAAPVRRIERVNLVERMLNPQNPDADMFVSALGANTAWTGMNNTGLAMGTGIPSISLGVVAGSSTVVIWENTSWYARMAILNTTYHLSTGQGGSLPNRVFLPPPLPPGIEKVIR